MQRGARPGGALARPSVAAATYSSVAELVPPSCSGIVPVCRRSPGTSIGTALESQTRPLEPTIFRRMLVSHRNLRTRMIEEDLRA